jgi:demethylmenaquinone methyltransferase/2-methoxy-6-polyprenyl-1,4-benzoquinol methylase
MSNTEQVHFGARKVPKEEKEPLVRGVFDRVAPRYDLMNDLMSGGWHRFWKHEMIEALLPAHNMHLLDVAGGTGDIAFRFLKAATGSCVTVCDINPHMLEEGRNRAIDRNILQDIEWVCGNAEKLPVEDNSMDAYTIAFGIRNVTDIPKALAEAYRVLKPGGRFLCLEFSRVKPDMLRWLYDQYSTHVIPKIGGLVVGDEEPYRYLVESIRTFPNQDAFAEMIRKAGFGQVNYRNLTGGVVALHSGWRT